MLPNADNSLLSQIDSNSEIMNDHWNNNGDDSTIIDIFDDIIKTNQDIKLT